jgi:hypothetical protein
MFITGFSDISLLPSVTPVKNFNDIHYNIIMPSPVTSPLISTITPYEVDFSLFIVNKYALLLDQCTNNQIYDMGVANGMWNISNKPFYTYIYGTRPVNNQTNCVTNLNTNISTAIFTATGG